jgi:phosphatidate phosphatase APP1
MGHVGRWSQEYVTNRSDRQPMWSFVFALTILMPDAESEINRDEVVVFYPTYAYQVDDGRAWSVEIHGVIFEPEEGSLTREATLGLLRRSLGLTRGQTDTELFKRRARAFLVDNERGKRITVRLGGEVYAAGTSAANGHFRAALKLPGAEVQRLVAADPDKPDWLAFQAVTRPGDRRTFAGRAQLIGPEGLSVISDVDDTIKISMVTDRRALVRNTFLRPFEPVEGMSALYRQWAGAGAAFHYVSASPWQLYGPLSKLLRAERFPPGPFHLKPVRLKDASALELFASQEGYKSKVIEGILADFPDRRFILVGDSGEQDPEIYAALAREHPGQIVRILIRDVDGSGRGQPRYKAAFEGIPGDRWRVFRDPDELGDFLPNVPPQP